MRIKRGKLLTGVTNYFSEEPGARIKGIRENNELDSPVKPENDECGAGFPGPWHRPGIENDSV
jgi:hypothetical protein